MLVALTTNVQIETDLFHWLLLRHLNDHLTLFHVKIIQYTSKQGNQSLGQERCPASSPNSGPSKAPSRILEPSWNQEISFDWEYQTHTLYHQLNFSIE